MKSADKLYVEVTTDWDSIVPDRKELIIREILSSGRVKYSGGVSSVDPDNIQAAIDDYVATYYSNSPEIIFANPAVIR